MKRKPILKALASALLTISTIMSGCTFNPDDFNKVMDNYFKNYKAMSKVETGSYEKFKDINVDSSYLGYGYNVIDDPYIDKNCINLSAPIIDMSKIDNVNLRMIKENQAYVQDYQSATMEDFYKNFATNINAYGKTGKMFAGGLKLDFATSTSEKKYYQFYKHVYEIRSFNIYITDSIESIKEILSEPFKKDLQQMAPNDLFNKYGTHMIKEAVMGGKIEINSTYSSETVSSSTSVDAAVNAHIKFLKGKSFNVEAGVKYENALTQQQITEKTEIKQYGGALVDLHTRESLAENYAKWVESFDNKLEYSALCGIVGEHSLVPLWELLPEGNETRAADLKNTFIELSENTYDELCSNFPFSGDVFFEDYYTGNTITVDKNNPYIHFTNEIPNIQRYYEKGYNKMEIYFSFYTKGTWTLFGGNVNIQGYLCPNENTSNNIFYFDRASDTDGKTIEYTVITDLVWFKDSKKIYLIFRNGNKTESVDINKITFKVRIYKE